MTDKDKDKQKKEVKLDEDILDSIMDVYESLEKEKPLLQKLNEKLRRLF